MILVCAATRTEANACRRGIRDAGARGLEVLTTGVGQVRAADALRRWLAARGGTAAPTLVVSSGFAGSLHAGVERLEWVTATAVARLVGVEPVAAALPRGLLRAADGITRARVISADDALARPVAGVEAPAVVDMESAALAEVAGSAGIAFAVLRLVTDTPAQPLAPLGRRIAPALAAESASATAAYGVRAALELVRSPRASAAFVRDALGWRERLRAGWKEHARRGVPCSPLP